MHVSLFLTCLADNVFPNVMESMVRILNRYEVSMDVPPQQTCCGQPSYNSGYLAETREVAKTLLTAFDSATYVVSPSGSCNEMIVDHYPELFADDPIWGPKARSLAGKMYEFSQFLVHVLGVTDVGAEFPHRVTYHPTCHASRLLGIRDEPLELLHHVRGLEFVDLPYAQDCCGFGGTFAVKMHDISAAMVAEKSQHIRETQADVLVGLDMGCLMNIGGKLRREGYNIRVMHLAQLLYEGIQFAELHGKEMAKS